MNNKHPERKPVHQVEGLIWVDDLEGKQLIINPKNERALWPLIQVLAKSANRQLSERHAEGRPLPMKGVMIGSTAMNLPVSIPGES